MLEAYYGEFSKDNSPAFSPYSLDELYALVDRLAAARPVSSYGRGMSGHHAWIVLKNRDFGLVAYFGEDCRSDGVVDFELRGPYPPGTDYKRVDPYDGRWLAGMMTITCLKAVLAQLDEGRSPVDYVRESALEAKVVTD